MHFCRIDAGNYHSPGQKRLACSARGTADFGDMCSTGNRQLRPAQGLFHFQPRPSKLHLPVILRPTSRRAIVLPFDRLDENQSTTDRARPGRNREYVPHAGQVAADRLAFRASDFGLRAMLQQFGMYFNRLRSNGRFIAVIARLGRIARPYVDSLRLSMSE